MTGSGNAGGGSGPRGRVVSGPRVRHPGVVGHTYYMARRVNSQQKNRPRRARGRVNGRRARRPAQMIGDTNPATETASRKVLTSGVISADPPGKNTGRNVRSKGAG